MEAPFKSHAAMVCFAAAVSASAHSEQLDKQGVPYFYHPFRVAETLRGWGLGHFHQAAALLHDVLEDTQVTAADLREAAVPDEVITAVILLTKADGEPNAPYWEALKQNEISRLVKIADMLDNSQPWRMEVTEHQSQEVLDHRTRKYAQGLTFLCGPWPDLNHMPTVITGDQDEALRVARALAFTVH